MFLPLNIYMVVASQLLGVAARPSPDLRFRSKLSFDCDAEQQHRAMRK